MLDKRPKLRPTERMPNSTEAEQLYRYVCPKCRTAHEVRASEPELRCECGYLERWTAPPHKWCQKIGQVDMAKTGQVPAPVGPAAAIAAVQHQPTREPARPSGQAPAATVEVVEVEAKPARQRQTRASGQAPAATIEVVEVEAKPAAPAPVQRQKPEARPSGAKPADSDPVAVVDGPPMELDELAVLAVREQIESVVLLLRDGAAELARTQELAGAQGDWWAVQGDAVKSKLLTERADHCASLCADMLAKAAELDV